MIWIMPWTKKDYNEYGIKCSEQGNPLEIYDKYNVSTGDTVFIYIGKGISATKNQKLNTSTGKKSISTGINIQ